MKGAVGAQAHVIEEINATLQGAVIDVLAQLVPEVQNLPRSRALEMILDDTRLLERCFQAFRDNPDRFRHLLVNRRKVPVRTADEILRCGRSLQDVVTILVRTAAKRHFRRRLDGANRPLRRLAGPRSSSLIGRLSTLMMDSSATARPGKTPGRLLYEAFQDHLRHDWQVALVPEYATLSPVLVRKLGARILDYRIAADIRRLRADPAHPPKPTPAEPPLPLLAPPPAMDAPRNPAEPIAAASAEADTSSRQGGPLISITGSRLDMPAEEEVEPAQSTVKNRRAKIEELVTPDGSRLRSGAFSLVLLDPDVRGVLPNPGAMLHITEVLSRVGSATARQLVEGLDLRTDQLAVLLICANQALGDTTFGNVFGNPGRSEVVARLVSRARALGVDGATPVGTVADLAGKGFSVGRARSQGAVSGQTL
jgi:hypothetical protein